MSKTKVRKVDYVWKVRKAITLFINQFVAVDSINIRNLCLAIKF